MRIGIDLRFTTASHMGTGSYAEWAAASLMAAAGADDEIIGFSEASFLPRQLAARIRHIAVPSASDRTDADAQRLRWDAAIERADLDVYYAPTGLAPVLATCPVVITIHDLLFEHRPDFFAPALLVHLKQEIPRSVAAADGIIAISAHTRSDLIRTYGVDAARIGVIPQGLRSGFTARPPESSIGETLREIGIDRPYLLMLSNLAPHKNLAFGLDCFAQWLARHGNQTHRLVIAGGGPAPHAAVDLPGLIRARGLDGRVVVVGRVDDRLLPGLYAGASLFLFPSLAEGWGLPPLEAMAMGTPSLVSDRGGLPEAVGAAARILPVETTDAWVDAMAELATRGPTEALLVSMRQRTDALSTARGPALIASLRDAIGRSTSSARKPLRTRGAITIPTSIPSEIPVLGVDASIPAAVAVDLCGCMIIRNGLKLGYPFVEAILAVIDHVESMVVVDGGSDDGTWEALCDMATTCPKLRLHRHPWPSTTIGGKVIAEATNHALGLCRGTHALYVQADELHTIPNLIRLRELLARGYASAAMPFLHFRTSWWKIIANPAYHATIRCVPIRPGVASVGDGTSFDGPLAPCAPPDAFPDYIFHVGWVYLSNIIAKHQSHAAIYTDLPAYQEKARLAAGMAGSSSADPALIDAEYRLLWFKGQHPPIMAHLIDQPRYDHRAGLSRWHAHVRGDGRRRAGAHRHPA